MTSKNTTFLALTSDQRFWDTSKEVLFLGEWCFTTLSPKSKVDYPFSVLKSYWDDRSHMEKTCMYLDKITERFLSIIGDILNEHHGVCYNHRQWRILLGCWLFHAVHHTYDRYIHLKKAIETKKNLITYIVPHNDSFVPRVSYNIKETVNNPVGHIILFSRLIEVLGLNSTYKNIVLDIDLNYLSIVNNRNILKEVLKSTLSKIHKRLFLLRNNKLLHRNDKGYIVITHFFNTPTLIRLIMLNKRALYINISSEWRKVFKGYSAINMHLRKKLFSKITAADEFENALYYCIPYIIPASYVEDFKRWHSHTSKYSIRNITSVLTSNGFSFNEPVTFLAARLIKDGVRLIGAQHGGGYGISKHVAGEIHEVACSDNYITWGWGNKPKYIPMPCPLTRKKVGCLNNRGRKRFLLLSTEFQLLAHRIESNPLSGQMPRYFAAQEKFYKALDNSTSHDFAYKPYARLFNNEGSDWYYNKSYKIKVVTDHISKLLLSTDVFIWDHNGTGLLETIAYNKPTLIFWDINVFEIRDDARRHFEEMASVGIFHHSPESAAWQLNKISDNPLQWWMGNNVQRARERFIRQYVRVSDNWKRDWKKLLAYL